MRIVWAALMALSWAGCSSSPAIVVTFSGSNATPSPGSGYDAPVGTVGMNQDQQLVLDSFAGGAELKISVDPPMTAGAITIGNAHIDVEYTLSPNGPTWASNSDSTVTDTVTFSTTSSPFLVSFQQLEMIGSTSTGADGAFFMDGTAQYSQ